MRSSPPLSEPPAIAAIGAWLPPGREDAAGAVAAGRLDTETAERLGYDRLAVSDEHAGPEMAVLAAGKALAEAGWSGADLDLVVHSWIYHQGHDFWSPPHYVASQVGAHDALAVGVQQTSNGCVAALEVALSRLAADPGVRRCLVTTGDRFAGPAFDRWFGDIDVAYGDAGTALLLDRSGGPYRLLSVASVCVPRYEVLYRGDDPFSPAPRTPRDRVDARRTKMVFRAGGGWLQFVGTLRNAVQRAVREALADADLTLDDPRVRYLYMPRIGTGAITQFYGPAAADIGLRHAEIVVAGRDTGHLGAGDPAANLADLDAGQLLAPGEVALLLSAGNGYTWSCVAVRRD
ncbi:ketoacyl-ACP synthase III family protein [Dactylosporangium aurantiacum]|uniref:Ketoacyl-ACP synthase III family protein n=1 Tax=Dactylosporangium aurantiacum TaxID=35754 RepID=A0A9Q9ICA4_9ACTN|nr:ketoacyl-ACP synthase III family protein [Dactylosporangium aurantiacum]MDG6106650.1 ketoacyl-ACP synthase III family protein [Dactylosporangium aurantiacum]UWZ50809.1 ketoacyl-ACP synthase III family protein [Dactylosporangium aurantiacum]